MIKSTKTELGWIIVFVDVVVETGRMEEKTAKILGIVPSIR